LWDNPGFILQACCVMDDPDKVPIGAIHASRGWHEKIGSLMKGRSLAVCAESGRDNILLLRLMAALMVVLGHSALAGAGSWPFDPINLILPQARVHLVGLVMFFMISGFLITLSFVRRPDLPRFLRARVLRLWPALVVCVLAWAFVLGPLLTDLPLREYFDASRADNPYGYAWTNISLFKLRMALPGLFQHNPTPGAVNGPLWTISVEATMYLWVAGAGTLRLLRFRWLTSIAIAAVFSWLLVWPMITGHFNSDRDLPMIVRGFFGAGAIACLLRRQLPISTGLMIALAVACLIASHTRHALPFLWLTVGYFVFWFAYVPRLPTIPGGVDLSYGVYLWAWPLQQSVVLIWNLHEPIVIFAIVTPIVLVIAALSWHYVEKPALRLKDMRWRISRGEPV
jgi:peptidoglycan/LPS O-acetylase OafA/YrhL